MDDRLASQLEYYRRRAPEYDQWFLRQGRYDRGEEWNQLWFHEVGIVHEDLASLGRMQRGLELACGTGLWTKRLVRQCESLTVVDGAPEMLDICRGRLADKGVDLSRVTFSQADLFAWSPEPETYDLVFMSFWLSHVPPERVARFLRNVVTALKPGGRVFILDSQHVVESTAKDHVLPDKNEQFAVRKLNDGSEYTIWKRFYTIAELTALLEEAGLEPMVSMTMTFFIEGIATKPAE